MTQMLKMIDHLLNSECGVKLMYIEHLRYTFSTLILLGLYIYIIVVY